MPLGTFLMPFRLRSRSFGLLAPPPILLPSFLTLLMHLLATLVVQRPNTDNPEWRKPRDHVEVDQFDIEIALGDALRVRVNDGDRWDLKDLIDPDLLIEAGLTTVPVVVSSPSLQGSEESPHPSALATMTHLPLLGPRTIPTLRNLRMILTNLLLTPRPSVHSIASMLMSLYLRVRIPLYPILSIPPQLPA
ncbi:hypothetical protein Dimus_026204 [Dionaea muscipula]